MTAEFEITRDDLIAFNLHHHYQSSIGRRQYRLVSWVGPSVALALVSIMVWYFTDWKAASLPRTALDLLPVTGLVAFHFFYVRWAYRRRVRRIITRMVSEGKNRALFGRHRVALSAEGITEAGELSQSATAWAAVERVSRHENYAFVYTSALSAIIVPRRAFATAAEFEQFVKTAGDYRAQAADSPV